MKNNETLTRTVLDLLHKAVIDQALIYIQDTNDIIDTYNDGSGQRQAYLSFYSHTSNGINITESSEYIKDVFIVRRKLSFINEGDEGKEDAILLTLHGNNISKAKEININGGSIIIDNIEINIRWD